MKSVLLIFPLFALLILPGASYAADERYAESGRDAYVMRLDDQYRNAVDLKEKGDYEASLQILQRLVDENQGMARFEIARLDTILEQGRDMKESGTPAWQMKAKEAGFRIKTILNSNAGNGDFWVVYAKYSALIEANKESHITKALKKAFYYKPNNPEAYLVQADYEFDKAKGASDSQQIGMTYGMQGNSSSQRFSLAQLAKTSYEAALAGNMSDARKAYAYLKRGNLHYEMMGDKDAARKDWETAVKLSPESRAAKLARLRLGN